MVLIVSIAVVNVIKLFLDKPSKPGKPVVDDYDEKSVDLIWEAPASDGGAQITHYLIQKKYRGNDK